MRVIFGVVCLALVGLPAFANPYQWIDRASDGTISGQCANSTIAFSGARNGDGYTFSTPGYSQYSLSRNDAIRTVCEQAASQLSGGMINLPTGTLVCFDRNWVEERSQSLATIKYVYQVVANRGVTSADCTITSSAGSYHLISRHDSAAAAYVFARDGENVAFFAFTSNLQN